MQENKFKNALYYTVLALILIIIIYFLSVFFADFKAKKEAEEREQQLLIEELERQEASERAKKILYLTGKFDPVQNDNFILIPSDFALLSGSKMYLRKETYAAFRTMESAARIDGISLVIASATRNFDSQKDLWNKKWSGVTLVDGGNLAKQIPDGLTRFKKILEWSAAPATSRHHWGTDIDINDADPEYFETEKGKKEYEWLVANAPEYGFCQVYNTKGNGRTTGYNQEKWHWSYLPLAISFTREYKELIKESDIFGFSGDTFVTKQDLINEYVLSLNPECL